MIHFELMIFIYFHFILLVGRKLRKRILLGLSIFTYPNKSCRQTFQPSAFVKAFPIKKRSELHLCIFKFIWSTIAYKITDFQITTIRNDSIIINNNCFTLINLNWNSQLPQLTIKLHICITLIIIYCLFAAVNVHPSNDIFSWYLVFVSVHVHISAKWNVFHNIRLLK